MQNELDVAASSGPRGHEGTATDTPQKEPRVSVIIPLFNKVATVERAIDSVLQQSYAHYEIIVVDDGSSDGSGQLVESHYPRLVRLVRQSNQGPGRARNRGAELAAGMYLAFLDADDEWRPDYLAAACSALDRNPHVLAYACGYDAGAFRHLRANKVTALGKSEGPAALNPGESAERTKTHVDALHSSSTVIRATTFRELGGYYDADHCLLGEDSWLWLKVLFTGPIYWDPAERSVFHVEDSSLGFARQGRHPIQPLLLHPEEARRVCPPDLGPCLERLMEFYFQTCRRMLVARGDLQQARRLRALHARESIRDDIVDLLRYAKHRLLTNAGKN